MTTQNHIDLDTPDDNPLQEWVESEWIGSGKKYPISGEVPVFIEAARSRALAVPSALSSYIPSQKMSITDLLKAELPAQSSALVMHAAAGAFSKEELNEDLTCLKMRPIPLKDWLEQLDKEFGPAWFNGAWSIKDKRYKFSLLPLGVLSYWKEMRLVIEKQSVWQAADEWLVRWGKGGEQMEEADRAREMMSCLTWGPDITVLGAGCPKQNLAVLLSDNWIDGETIDMMMFDLASRVRLDPELRKTSVVAALNLQMHIHRAYDSGDYSKKSVPLLCRYTKLFKEKKCSRLYFPAHINGNHWVPFVIDFQKETIRHG